MASEQLNDRSVYLIEEYRGLPAGTHLVKAYSVTNSGFACLLCVVDNKSFRERLKCAGVSSLGEYMNEYPTLATPDALHFDFETVVPLVRACTTSEEISSRKAILQKELSDIEVLENNIERHRPMPG